jgi:hypothetical protein
MKKTIYLFVVLCLLFCACHDVSDLVNAEDQLVAISQVDLNFSFDKVSTFSVNDTISEISIDALGNKTKSKILATYQKELIINQMVSRGFEYLPFDTISGENPPDLFIDLIYVENKYVQVSSYGWWYDYIDPYWNYWNPYYPYYPYYPVSYTTITSYTAKSLIVDCMNIKETPDHKYRAESCFIGLVRGIAEKYSDKDISKYINQCFDQTPELKK